MKRIGPQLGVALITFCLGVGAARIVLLISLPPSHKFEPSPVSEIIIYPPLETPSTVPAEPVSIKFKSSYKNRYGVIVAEFNITNISNVPVSYAGDYSNPNWNRYYAVKRGSQVEESDRRCATGLASHTLSPGKSVLFEVVTDKEGRMQIGFDFFIEEKHLRQTVWSDEVYVSE